MMYYKKHIVLYILGVAFLLIMEELRKLANLKKEVLKKESGFNLKNLKNIYS